MSPGRAEDAVETGVQVAGQSREVGRPGLGTGADDHVGGLGQPVQLIAHQVPQLPGHAVPADRVAHGPADHETGPWPGRGVERTSGQGNGPNS